MTTDAIQVRWDAAQGGWERLDVGAMPSGRSSARDVIGGGGLTLALPRDATGSGRRDRPAFAADVPACRPLVTAGSVIPMPATTITYAAMLVQPRLKDGKVDEGLSWSINGRYGSTSSTFVGKTDHVKLKANFEATFGQIKLGLSGERALDSSQSTAGQVGIEYGWGLIAGGNPVRKVYGLRWRTWAQVYECIDIPASYAAGRAVYARAFAGIQLADAAQEDPIFGAEVSQFPDLEIKNGMYVRPCGESRGNDLSTVPGGTSLSRHTGSSQTYSEGTTITMGAALAGLSGQQTRSETSRVEVSSLVHTTWTNNQEHTKYLCGYSGRPSDPNDDPGYVVAMGADPQ